MTQPRSSGNAGTKKRSKNSPLRSAKVVPAGYTVLGWRVSDIAAVAAGLRDAGVKFERYPGMDQDELGVWRSPSGAGVAWFKDPDGNTLSVTQY